MRGSRFKATECQISCGGFSDERVFTLPGGYSGVASRQYFWTRDGRPPEEGEPPVGQVIDGFVAVRAIQAESDGRLLVSQLVAEVPSAVPEVLSAECRGTGN